MATLKVGSQAPAFSLKDTNGKTVKLADFKGKTVALYFYPKDNTPGCTTQACNLRDNYEELKKNKIVILGVSPDGEKSHQKFTEKHGLPFNLLCDEDHKIAEKYGAWGLKKFMGREFMGILRSTYIIGPDGKLAAIIAKPKVGEHAAQILEALKG